MSKEELEAIRERADKATNGPWIDCLDQLNVNGAGQVIDHEWGDASEADRDFIAHSRDDIPALLGHVAYLEAALTQAVEYAGLAAMTMGPIDRIEHPELAKWLEGRMK